MTGQADTTGRNPAERLRLTAGAALTVVVLVAASGCSSSGGSKAASAEPTSAGAPVADAGVTEPAVAATTGAAAAPANMTGAAAPTTAGVAGSANNGSLEGRPGFDANQPIGRSIVYTATVNVEVKTAALVATQADAAAADAENLHGYVFARDGQAADNSNDGPVPVPSGQAPAPTGVAEADVTIKVPPAQFDELLTDLEGLGHELSVQQTSQDVTDQVVDTKARLATYQASVARVRALLAKASTIGQVVEIEGELTTREANLESMEGELNVLNAQTSYGTITLHLQSKSLTQTVVPPKPKRPIHGFIGGLKAGGRGFARVAIGIATVTGATLPFVGTLLVLAVIAWLLRRQWLAGRRRAATEQVTP